MSTSADSQDRSSGTSSLLRLLVGAEWEDDMDSELGFHLVSSGQEVHDSFGAALATAILVLGINGYVLDDDDASRAAMETHGVNSGLRR